MAKNKFWVLRAIADITYDCYDGFVIKAETEQEAREIAQRNGADETERQDTPFWLSPQMSSCVLIEKADWHERGWKDDKINGVILGSFNAG